MCGVTIPRIPCVKVPELYDLIKDDLSKIYKTMDDPIKCVKKAQICLGKIDKKSDLATKAATMATKKIDDAYKKLNVKRTIDQINVTKYAIKEMVEMDLEALFKALPLKLLMEITEKVDLSKIHQVLSISSQLEGFMKSIPNIVDELKDEAKGVVTGLEELVNCSKCLPACTDILQHISCDGVEAIAGKSCSVLGTSCDIASTPDKVYEHLQQAIDDLS